MAVAVVILLGLAFLRTSPKYGNASSVSTASQLYDLELNNSAGIGNASIYVNGTKYSDSSGDWLGNILQTASTAVNTLLGTTITNELIQGAGGFSAPSPISTSTSLTAAQFCATTAIKVINTPANATLTLPTATSTWLACGSPAAGSWSTQVIINDSTNTVSEVAGVGMHLQNASATTAIAGALLSPSSTWTVMGIWDTTSTLDILQTQFH